MNRAELLNDSYERVLVEKYEPFFREFYDRFIGSSPEIARIFAGTDESRRFAMLEESLLILMDYSIDGEAKEELQHLAAVHKRIKISDRAFDVWLDALVNTLYEIDTKFDVNYERAWRETLQPGIDYMRSYTA